jgi:hypothetical protein
MSGHAALAEPDAKFENEENNQDQNATSCYAMRCAGMNCHPRRLAKELRRQ